MSAAEQIEPLPAEIPSRWRALLEALSAQERANLRWIGGEIHHGWWRLMNQPLSRGLVREVSARWMRVFSSIGAAVLPHLRPDDAQNYLHLSATLGGENLHAAWPLLKDTGAWFCLCRVISSYRWFLDFSHARGVNPLVEISRFAVTSSGASPLASEPDLLALANSDLGGLFRAWVLGQVILENLLAGRGEPARIIPLLYLAMEDAVDGGLALLRDEHISEQYEQDYLLLGRRTPDPLPRASRLLPWILRGEWGGWWLVRRLRTETDAGVLDDAASLLADLKEAAFWPILLELKNPASAEQAETLLAALELLQREEDTPGRLPEIADHLRPLTLNTALDVRLRAYRVLRVLPEDRVRPLVEEAAGLETHPEGAEALQEIRSTFAQRA